MKQIIIEPKELEQIVAYLETVPYKYSATLMVFLQTKLQQVADDLPKEALVADEDMGETN